MSDLQNIEFIIWLKEYVVERYLAHDGEELREVQKYAGYHGYEDAFDDAVEIAREKQKLQAKANQELV